MPPYTRACATCSRAKSRCVARADGGSCERCHRLSKACLPSASAAIRSRSPGMPSTPRVVPLEESLDRLVTLLQNQQNASRDGDEAPASLGSPPVLAASKFDVSIAATILPCPGEPSPLQAEEYLASFRTHMLRFFPVICLPPDMSSDQLKKGKPFLWLCIMSVACTSTSHQLVLGDSIRHIVGRELVYRSQKNMDLLLGLLIFIAWAHYQTQYMAFLSDFMQLSMSLVFDLGLNKSAEDSRGPISFKPATQGKTIQARPISPSRKEKTMEERRAVLACFLLSSTLAATLKRLDGLRWTPSMDESLALLSEKPECLEDKILAIQVKLQLLIMQLNRSQCTWPFGNSRYAPNEWEPPQCYLDALVLRIEKIRSEIPPELAHSDLSRLQRFAACMQSIKSWFDVFFDIPPPSYVGFTFPFMCGVAYNLLALVRFSTIEDPAWDKSSVRKTVDILAVCDKLVENYEFVVATCRLLDESEEMDFFADCVKAFQCMGKVWKRDLDISADHSSYDHRHENFEDISFGFTTDWIDASLMMNLPSF